MITAENITDEQPECPGCSMNVNCKPSCTAQTYPILDASVPWQWLVVYKVGGKQYSAGPWLFDEALEHLRDIRGFEHVTDARMKPTDVGMKRAGKGES